MGARKRVRAEKLKAEKRQKAIASLCDCPTSPLKMRIVADMIRGVEINKALGMLRYSKKEASNRLEKLLRSAIANWQSKNEGESLENTPLCVKEIYVDGGRQIKRIQPAPQGRAHRVRKRSNHVTLVVDRLEATEKKAKAAAPQAEAPKAEAKKPAARKTVAKATKEVKPQNVAE